MSDTESAPQVPTKDGKGEADNKMPQGDIDFILTCVQNSVGGQIQVDPVKVAAALGYKNPRSVKNRMAMIKKKYSLNLSSSKVDGGEGSQSAAFSPGPKTPTANRVSKPKGTPTPTKKTGSARRKPVSKTKTEEDDEIEVKDENGSASGGSSLAVQLAPLKFEQAVYGDDETEEEA